jgi:hypothetical protein
MTTSVFGNGISPIKKENTASSKINQMNYEPDPGIIAEYTWEYLGSNQVKFTDASTGGGGPVQWAWDFTDDGIDDAWGPSVTHTYPGSGPYYCDHWVKGNDDTQSQVLKPVRWDGGIIAEYTCEYLNNYQVKFTDTSTGGGGVKQMAWDFTNDGTDDAWGNPAYYTYPGSGPYYCDHWVKGNDDTQSQVLKPVRPSLGGGGNGADLYCIDSIAWTGVKPGSTVHGSFELKNKGSAGSELNWEIYYYPSWGTWSFNPSSGSNLKPEDGPVTVEVTVVAPNEKLEYFDGFIGLQNTDNTSDKGLVVIQLVTPVNIDMPFQQFFERFFQRFPNAFPLLRHLMGY